MSAETLSKVGKYRILGEINRGSTGVVYRAELNGTQYALKVLKVNNAANAARMRKETAAIARLNNPHLVQIVDANEDGGSPFIVMELLEGKNLNLLVKEGALDERLSLQVATSITSALSEMHRFRMLHRDIKPANIVMTNAGVIKLVDLGLTADTADLKEENENTVVGTILYSSPEQCRILKRPVDGRSDLYSLGITLYECITGKVPFDSKNAAEIIKMHAAVRAPSVAEKVPTVSPVLAAIVAKLIEKDPDDRYQSAEGLKYDLENLAEIQGYHQATGKMRLGVRDQILGTGIEIPIFGRDTELGTLRGYLSDLQANKGHAVIIEGEGGCGKSRLTQDLINQAILNNHLILKAKCQVLASRIPFASIKEALNQFLEKLKDLPDETEKNQWYEWIRESAGDSKAALCEFSAAFVPVLGEAKGQVLLNDESDRLKFFDDLLKFFSELSRRAKGIALVIDDIQWMDDSTSEFLTKLAERLSTISCFLMMTARNDRDSIAALNRFKEQTGPALAPSIVLNPLPENSVGQIIAAQIGKGSLDEVSVRRIAKAANGNPFAVIEYVRTLMASGHLSFVEGQWQINQAGISTITLSQDIFKLVINRIEDLHASAKHVLGLSAVVGNVFSLDVLTGASGLSVEQVIFALQEAEKHNLIEAISHARYRFSHDRIREALSNSLSEEARKDINDRLAAYVDGLPNRDEFWFDLARYYTNGNFEKHLPRAAEANFRAGALAIADFSYQQAFDLLMFAFRCTQRFDAETALKIGIARNLAVAAGEIGRASVAERAIDYAVGLSQNNDERVELRQIKMRAYYNTGRLLHAWIEFKVIADLLGWRFPKYELLKWIQINWLALTVALRLITGWGQGAIPERHRKRKEYESLANLFFLGSCVARFRDRSHWILTMLKSLQYSILLNDRDRLARSLTMLTIFFGPFRLRSLVKTLLQQTRELAEASNNDATLAQVEFAAQTALYTSGSIGTRDLRIRHAENSLKVANLLGPYEYSMWATNFPGHLVMTGENLEGFQAMQASLPRIEAMNSKWVNVSSLCCLQQHLGQLGMLKELNETRAYQARLMEPEVKDIGMGLVYYSISHFHTWMELGEIGTDTDFMIDVFMSLRMTDHYVKYIGLAAVMYIRLQQLEKSKNADERRRARLKLKTVLRELYFSSYSPLLKCHWYIGKAGLERCQGRLQAALRLAEEGYQTARQAESKVAIFFASREKARIFDALGDMHKRDMEIALSLTLAEENNWTLRSKALHEEWGTRSMVLHNFGRASVASRSSNSAVAGSRQTLVHTMVAKSTDSSMSRTSVSIKGGTITAGTIAAGSKQSVTKEERAMAALLAVSLASTQSSDPEQKSLAVLNEVIRLFGAERAFLFLTEEASGMSASKSDATEQPQQAVN